MKKEQAKQTITIGEDEDTMRSEYDFTKAKRGETFKRYLQGTNVVVLDPDVVKIFPNAASVNEALRALGGIIRKIPRPKGGRFLTTP